MYISFIKFGCTKLKLECRNENGTLIDGQKDGQAYGGGIKSVYTIFQAWCCPKYSKSVTKSHIYDIQHKQ